MVCRVRFKYLKLFFGILILFRRCGLYMSAISNLSSKKITISVLVFAAVLGEFLGREFASLFMRTYDDGMKELCLMSAGILSLIVIYAIVGVVARIISDTTYIRWKIITKYFFSVNVLLLLFQSYINVNGLWNDNYLTIIHWTATLLFYAYIVPCALYVVIVLVNRYKNSDRLSTYLEQDLTEFGHIENTIFVDGSLLLSVVLITIHAAHQFQLLDYEAVWSYFHRGQYASMVVVISIFYTYALFYIFKKLTTEGRIQWFRYVRFVKYCSLFFAVNLILMLYLKDVMSGQGMTGLNMLLIPSFLVASLVALPAQTFYLSWKFWSFMYQKFLKGVSISGRLLVELFFGSYVSWVGLLVVIAVIIQGLQLPMF